VPGRAERFALSKVLLRCEPPALPRRNDCGFDIVFAAHPANNTNTANARWDLLCIGAADKTLHVFTRQLTQQKCSVD
jgi:hypothetical protein